MNEKEFYCPIVDLLASRKPIVEGIAFECRTRVSGAQTRLGTTRPAGLALDDRSSRRSYGMIDGKSRPGKRAAGLGPGYVVRLINTSAPVPVTFLGPAGIANALRALCCEPWYATYRSEFVDPWQRGARSQSPSLRHWSRSRARGLLEILWFAGNFSAPGRRGRLQLRGAAIVGRNGVAGTQNSLSQIESKL